LDDNNQFIINLFFIWKIFNFYAIFAVCLGIQRFEIVGGKNHAAHVIASVILKLSGCDKSLSHGMQDFIFTNTFKSFGVAVASVAFKCA